MIYDVYQFLLTHSISTSVQIMFEKGDVPFTNNPNDWSDYMISRMEGWFKALGFIWLPAVKYMLTNCTWQKSYIIFCMLNIAIVCIFLTPDLEVQVVGFALFFNRLMLFRCHHTYLLDVFGISTFGTLKGISSFLDEILGLLSYPLQLFALKTTYALSFVPIGILVVLALVFPLMLHNRYQQK